MTKNRLKLSLRWKAVSTVLALLTIVSSTFFANPLSAQSKVFEVDRFDEIVVSPHIEVIFKEGKESSVRIEAISVPMDKLNVSVENDKLHLYLEDAKITSPSLKDQIKGTCDPTEYDGTVVRAVVTYERLKSADLRGEQKFVFESKIDSRKLRLKIYGESQVYLNEVEIEDLHVTMYGESELKILKGEVEDQTFTVYGESEVQALSIDNEETKVTVYGEGEFQLNVSEKLIVTSYGEASIEYAGKAKVQKRIIIGETEISKLKDITESSSTQYYKIK